MVRGIEGRRSEALGAAVVERARQGFGWVERATGERRASEPELRNVTVGRRGAEGTIRARLRVWARLALPTAAQPKLVAGQPG